MSWKKKISEIFYYQQWLFSTKHLRSDFKRFKVLSIEKTIDEVYHKKKSISRFGDGEFRLIASQGHYLEFQENSNLLSEKLQETLQSNLENHLVCLPEQFHSFTNFNISTKYWWKKFINHYGKILNPYLNRNKVYGNSFVSRFYLGYKDKTNKRNDNIIKMLKEIWHNQEILLVEGRYSRLGVGNNLFNNSKSIQRILCPDKNAFRHYDKILESARKYGENKIVLIALGPTATILAHDLAKDNYWALDIGHIDIEYMWFLQSAQEKLPIAGRYVNEAAEQKSLDISGEFLQVYLNSIILEIKE